MESSAMVDGYSMQGCRDFPPHNVCFKGILAPSTLACIRVSPLPTVVSGNYDYETRVGCPDLCFWESRYVEPGRSVGFGVTIGAALPR